MFYDYTINTLCVLPMPLFLPILYFVFYPYHLEKYYTVIVKAIT